MFNINFLHKKNISGNNSVLIDDHKIRLVISIGNPGDKYKKTYHNVGFLFVDSLLETKEGNEGGQKTTWKSIKSFRYVKLENTTLIKITSFVNNSGTPVASAIKYFGVSLDEVLIIHDDSDISLGEYKISFGRGSAGHNGIESIIKALKTKDFLRMRIGIRTDRKSAGDFVLNKIPQKEFQEFQELFAKIQRLYFKSDSK